MVAIDDLLHGVDIAVHQARSAKRIRATIEYGSPSAASRMMEQNALSCNGDARRYPDIRHLRDLRDDAVDIRLGQVDQRQHVRRDRGGERAESVLQRAGTGGLRLRFHQPGKLVFRRKHCDADAQDRGAVNAHPSCLAGLSLLPSSKRVVVASMRSTGAVLPPPPIYWSPTTHHRRLIGQPDADIASRLQQRQLDPGFVRRQRHFGNTLRWHRNANDTQPHAPIGNT